MGFYLGSFQPPEGMPQGWYPSPPTAVSLNHCWRNKSDGPGTCSEPPFRIGLCKTHYDEMRSWSV